MEKKKMFSFEKKETGTPKKKEPGAKLKKNTFLRFGRMALWGMLIFIFLKGVASTFRADTLAEAQKLIADFEVQLEQNKKINTEIGAFAQNFVKEYLTYEVNAETDYKNRLMAYMKQAGSVEGVRVGKGQAKAVYVQSYRMEQCSDFQWDVYVLAEVEYTENVMDVSTQEYQKQVTYAQTCLKVPVYCSGGCMTVESLPLFISDSLLLEDYTANDYIGTAADENTVTAAETTVNNFLKAYYEQDATVIDYYLSEDARKEQFRGLDGRYRFEKLENLKCYREPGQNVVISIVEFTVQDSINNARIRQKLCIQVVQETDGKYYIRSINPRTTLIY